MKRCCFFGFLLLVALSVTTDAEPPSPPTLDIYQQYVVAELNLIEGRAAESPTFGSPALMAAEDVRVWQWTRDPKLLSLALARLHGVPSGPPIDFFALYPLTYCVDVLSRAGKMDPALRAQLGDYIAQKVSLSEGNDLMNRALLRACGFANAAKLWPDSPMAPRWKTYADHLQEMALQTQDVPENAPNYNRYDLVGLFILGDVLGADALFSKPGIKQMYLRLRDEIAPSGGIAPYGDSGGAIDNEAMPIDFNTEMIAAGFERAARFYHDPTLRWAAIKTFSVDQRNLTSDPKKLGIENVKALFYLSFAHDWADFSMQPIAPMLGSEILMRPSGSNLETKDKLILRTPSKDLPAFLLTDLFDRLGGHSHENQQGAVNYFEVGDYPIISGLGYDNRRPEDTSLFLVAAAGESFPFKTLVAQKWENAQLPLAGDKSLLLTSIAFRVVGHKAGVSLWTSNLQLETDEGSTPVPNAQDPTQWEGRPASTVVKEDGRDALRWDFPSGVSVVGVKNLSLTLDPSKHPRLSFWWKLSNADELARPLIVRTNLGDIHADLRPLRPVLMDAVVEDKGDSHYGRISFDRWFCPDTRMERQMTLLNDGTLVVADMLWPGPSALGMQAGPVWNPVSRNVVQKSDHEFVFGPPAHSFHVVLASDTTATYGTRTVDVWSKKGHVGIYGHTLISGAPVHFVTVFTPASVRIVPTVSFQSQGCSISLADNRILTFLDSGALEKKLK